MDVTLGLEGTHALITGAAGLIGSVVARAFLSAGCKVSCLDIAYDDDNSNSNNNSQEAANPSDANYINLHCDISDERSVQAAFAKARSTFGPVSVAVALAALDLSVLDHHESSTTLTAAQWRRAIDVNVTGTFLTAREWLRGLEETAAKEPRGEEGSPSSGGGLRNAALVVVGSESGRFGERTNAAYSTSKSAVQGGLMLSFAADAPRVWEGARVNAVAPGPVHTTRFDEECEANPRQYYEDAQASVPLCRPVPVEQVARTILMLASERFSGSIHGQIIPVDNGKQGKLYYTEAEGKAKRQDLDLGKR